MSEIFEEEDDTTYSPFWPLIVLMAGLIFWSGYQAWVAYEEKATFENELKAAAPSISEAQKSEAQLFSLFQDLVQTSAKNANAAQIVKDSHMQLKPPANSDASDASTPPSTPTP